MGEKKEKKSKKEKKDKEDAPAEEVSASEDAPAPAPAADKPKKVGNVFALFNQGQIQEFKEDKKKERKSKRKEKTEESADAGDAGSGEDKPVAKPAKRGTSNVFALFNQSQIQEFKEDKKKERKSKRKEKTEEKTDDGGSEETPKEPKRAQRATSNVFALFNQSQIQEFKEAFQMMDVDRDGFISMDDLGSIYQQTGREPETNVLKEMIKEAPGQLNFTAFLTLFGEKMHGRSPDDKLLKQMVDEAPGPLNFTMFLTIFGDKLKGTDPESTLRDAFAMFDENKTGKIEENYMKHLLTEVGDLFTKEEMKLTWKEAPIEGGQLDYLTFVQYIKRGKEGEE